MKTWRPNEPDLEIQIHTLSMCSEFPLTDLHTPKAQSFPSHILMFSGHRVGFFFSFLFPTSTCTTFLFKKEISSPKCAPGISALTFPLTAITHLGVSLTQKSQENRGAADFEGVLKVKAITFLKWSAILTRDPTLLWWQYNVPSSTPLANNQRKHRLLKGIIVSHNY